MRATSKVVVSSGSPSWTMQDLAVVPPMSKHRRRSSPSRRANQLPASAPAAGPDSTRRIGAAAASSADTTPPLDSIISTEPPKPCAGQPLLQLVEVRPDHGMVAALQAVVIMRGYSRIWGEISDEMHTGTPSSRRRCSRHGPLVVGVGVGVDEADTDRVDAGVAQLLRDGVEAFGRGRRLDHAVGARALDELDHALAGHRWLRGTRSAGRTCRSGARCGSAACPRSRPS